MRRVGRGRVAIVIGAVVLPFALAPAEARAQANAAQDLCSKEGLMRLVPQLRNAEGKFQIPNPENDLAGFLAAQQGLSNAIDMILAQANASGNPYEVAPKRHAPLTFGSHWRAAEVGVQTDGKKISFVDPKFASYGGASFLEGLRPVAESKGVFYLPGPRQAGERRRHVGAGRERRADPRVPVGGHARHGCFQDGAEGP